MEVAFCKKGQANEGQVCAHGYFALSEMFGSVLQMLEPLLHDVLASSAQYIILQYHTVPTDLSRGRAVCANCCSQFVPDKPRIARAKVGT